MTHKILKNRFPLFFLLACALSTSCTSQKITTNTIVIDRPLIQNLETAHKDLIPLKHSLVRLNFVNEKNEESFGTGFFFQTRELLVSSLHVFDPSHPCLKNEKCEIKLGFAKSSTEMEQVVVSAHIAMKDAERDLIFLKIKQTDKLSQVIPLQKGLQSSKGKITAAGFYQDEQALTFSQGKHLRSQDGSTLTSIIVGHGFSGSPVINDKGEVLGVVCSFQPIKDQQIGLARFVGLE